MHVELGSRTPARRRRDGNISFADTKSIALSIAQAFAEQGRSPARQ
jgi:hypothetical protein